MKKILAYISIVALAAGCELYGPDQESTVPVPSKGIDVTVNGVTDESVTFTLAPKGESSYYSYLVAAGEADEVDPSQVLSVKYKGVAQGTISYAEKNSAQLTVGNLSPNAYYTVYAVAASTTGIASEVVTATFKTTDGGVPALASFSAADSVVVLTYSEAVKAGTPDITVKYYALNSVAFTAGTPEGSVKAIVDKVSANTVSIHFDDVPAGAYFAVDIAAGSFTDLAGNPCAAVESSLLLDGKTYTVSGEGVRGQRDAVPFSLGECADEFLTDWESPILVEFGSELGYGYTYKDPQPEIICTIGSKTTTYTLTRNVDFAYISSIGMLAFFLPEEPERGAEITVHVPAEVFEDYYGNLNEEWSSELIYSYGYEEDAILGSFNAAFASAFNGAEFTGVDTIVASDDPENGNIMFTSFAGLELDYPLYATFDPVGGTISIPSLQVVGTLTSGETEYYLVFCNGVVSGGQLGISKSDAVFSVPTIDSYKSTGYFGLVIFTTDYSPVTWYNAYSPYTGERAPEEAVAAVNAYSVESKSLFPLGTAILK
ncbi:MAG: hypothetical protein ACI3ZT_04485 [Candidatus Cryptobacteroides sp.]